mmetsp:Transcript_3586/g.7918  ORF Transcript_3586/g.7918 Transcript_3586/m.7918 type:complete len:206 (-) Transcript_3586:427-1044(-)
MSYISPLSRNSDFISFGTPSTSVFKISRWLALHAICDARRPSSSGNSHTLVSPPCLISIASASTSSYSAQRCKQVLLRSSSVATSILSVLFGLVAATAAWSSTARTSSSASTANLRHFSTDPIPKIRCGIGERLHTVRFFAPAVRSTCMHSSWRHMMATCNGVQPSWSRFSRSLARCVASHLSRTSLSVSGSSLCSISSVMRWST